MLADLEAFAGDERTARDRPAAPKPKPWLVIEGGWNDPKHARWLRRIAQDVMADAGWQEWWSTVGLGRLHLAPRVYGPPDRCLSFRRQKDRLGVVACSAELNARLRPIMADSVAELRFDQELKKRGNPPLHEWFDDMPDLLRALILSMFHLAADYLRVSSPPDSLPPR